MQAYQVIPSANDTTKVDEIWMGNRIATAMFYVREISTKYLKTSIFVQISNIYFCR